MEKKKASTRTNSVHAFLLLFRYFSYTLWGLFIFFII